MNLIIGMLIILLGITILYYRFQIYEFTGEWTWVNTYLGSNGTIVAISLIGMILIAIGTAYPFGVIDIGTTSDAIPTFQIR